MSEILPEGSQVSLSDGRNFTVHNFTVHNFTVHYVSNMVGTDGSGQTYYVVSARANSVTHAVTVKGPNTYCGRAERPNWVFWDAQKTPVDCKRCQKEISKP
jgi:hypothetical protein